MKAFAETKPPNSASVPNPAMPLSWLGFTARAQEPWLLRALAAAMAVLAAFGPGMSAGWVLAAAALAASAWSARRPARHQAEVALRYSLLALAGLLLELGAHGQAEALTFAAWLGAIALSSALLLLPCWAAGVLALVLVAAGVGPWELPRSAGLWVSMLGAAVLASQAGLLLRRLDVRRNAARVDPSTGLFSQAGLVSFGDDLLDGCRRSGRPTAMVVFDCTDLAEVGSVYGARVARAMRRKLIAGLSAVACPRGLVGRTGPTQFAVVLPGLDQEQALRRVQHVLGTPSCIEYDSRGSEIVLVPDLAVESTSAEVTDCSALYKLLDGRLARVRDFEQRRQHRLRRSRKPRAANPSVPVEELQSQPMPVVSTLPMPLSATA